MVVIWNLKDTALINEREGFDGGRTFISGNKGEGGGRETIWDLDSGDEDNVAVMTIMISQKKLFFSRVKAI